jgi:hypothetical protein
VRRKTGHEATAGTVDKRAATARGVHRRVRPP